MFIYLSKKIAIPNNVALKSISWNKDKGYIACGGDDGLLKVLRLESQTDGEVRGLAAPSSLSMNQTLEGHSGAVQVVMWNEKNLKLTTSDLNGLIIVWMLHKGSWFEEMINNRHKSVVRSMCWNKPGDKIAIVYEDGAVIVGSVDGNRIWGRELKHTLTHVEWSPDSKHILFALGNGEIHIYDNGGNFMSKVQTDFFQPATTPGRVASLTWYNGDGGYPAEQPHCLAICYETGNCQIMRHELDDEPVLIDTNMQIVMAAWNHNGSCLAVAGKQSSSDKKNNVLQFFSHTGEHLRSLRVPGNSIECCSWEGGGLRIALAVDSFIYFANIRPNYKWGYCSNTVVYEYSDSSNATQVVFWDVKHNERQRKRVSRLLAVTAQGEYCCLVSKQADDTPTDVSRREEFTLGLYNSIGTPLETKFIYFEPQFVCMTSTLVVAANRDVLYTWQFTDPIKLMSHDLNIQSKDKNVTQRLMHIDASPESDDSALTFDSWSKADKESHDAICAVAASDKLLLVARCSGVIHRYSLPGLRFKSKMQVDSRPYSLYINCDSTRVCVIDMSGALSMWSLDAVSVDAAGNEVLGRQMAFERKDVWDVRWAADNPLLLALMEKTRMYIIRDTEPEEPILSSGYLCHFENLCVRSVLLDEVLQSPEQSRKDNIVDKETRSLRDLRDMINNISLEDTRQYIQDNPHPRLWSLLAEKALEQLQLDVAESSMVQCKDYPGIQFVKRLKNLQNDTLRKAEVAAYLNKFDEADKLYYEMDRKDLAVELRQKLGDWVRVVQLLKAGSDGGDDSKLEAAFNSIGDYYAHRQHWSKAVVYYSQGRNQERLAECYYNLEDFESLSTMASYLADNHPLLPSIARMFVSVGMSNEAVDAFKKCNRMSDAIDCCILLNQWNAAIDLAKQSHSRDIDNMLARYATQLIDKGRIIAAVELYKKAGHFLHAAKRLMQIAKEESQKKSNPLRIKKIYVLAGKLVELHKDRSLNSSIKAGKNSGDALTGLLGDASFSQDDSKVIENAWRGAEAYHFYVLAQRQFHADKVDAAMRTCMQLQDYEEFIDPVHIYSLLALSAVRARSFDMASKAFVKLQYMQLDNNDLFEQLASHIFIRHPPKSKASLERDTCLNCGELSLYKWSKQCENEQCNSRYSVCVVTGRPIFNWSFWVCPCCKHKADSRAVEGLQWCPLCHMEPVSTAANTTAR